MDRRPRAPDRSQRRARQDAQDTNPPLRPQASNLRHAARMRRAPTINIDINKIKSDFELTKLSISDMMYFMDSFVVFYWADLKFEWAKGESRPDWGMAKELDYLPTCEVPTIFHAHLDDLIFNLSMYIDMILERKLIESARRQIGYMESQKINNTAEAIRNELVKPIYGFQYIIITRGRELGRELDDLAERVEEISPEGADMKELQCLLNLAQVFAHSVENLYLQVLFMELEHKGRVHAWMERQKFPDVAGLVKALEDMTEEGKPVLPRGEKNKSSKLPYELPRIEDLLVLPGSRDMEKIRASFSDTDISTTNFSIPGVLGNSTQGSGDNRAAALDQCRGYGHSRPRFFQLDKKGKPLYTSVFSRIEQEWLASPVANIGGLLKEIDKLSLEPTPGQQSSSSSTTLYPAPGPSRRDSEDRTTGDRTPIVRNDAINTGVTTHSRRIPDAGQANMHPPASTDASVKQIGAGKERQNQPEGGQNRRRKPREVKKELPGR